MIGPQHIGAGAKLFCCIALSACLLPVPAFGQEAAQAPTAGGVMILQDDGALLPLTGPANTEVNLTSEAGSEGDDPSSDRILDESPVPTGAPPGGLRPMVVTPVVIVASPLDAAGTGPATHQQGPLHLDRSHEREIDALQRSLLLSRIEQDDEVNTEFQVNIGLAAPPRSTSAHDRARNAAASLENLRIFNEVFRADSVTLGLGD